MQEQPRTMSRVGDRHVTSTTLVWILRLVLLLKVVPGSCHGYLISSLHFLAAIHGCFKSGCFNLGCLQFVRSALLRLFAQLCPHFRRISAITFGDFQSINPFPKSHGFREFSGEFSARKVVSLSRGHCGMIPPVSFQACFGGPAV